MLLEKRRSEDGDTEFTVADLETGRIAWRASERL
jgi:hypothetical protein